MDHSSKAIALLFVLLCLGASLPPLPPAPVKRVKAPAQGSGAALLIRKTVVVPALVVLIRWNYSNESGVWFNVRRLKTSAAHAPSTDWPIIATVSTNSYRDSVDSAAKVVLYTVTATNTVYGLESSWATK